MKTAIMDDNAVLFVGGMAAAVVTVIASTRLVEARQRKRRITLVRSSNGVSNTAPDCRDPRKRHT